MRLSQYTTSDFARVVRVPPRGGENTLVPVEVPTGVRTQIIELEVPYATITS